VSEPFVAVTDAETLERLFNESVAAPVLLFKHDPYCGISTDAYDELTELQQPVHLIDVASQRELARAVALRTRVRHESPQVLVLRGGEADWSASHGAITTEAVQRRLDHAAGVSSR
jgi:bacillithiol system protein YtxJ